MFASLAVALLVAISPQQTAPQDQDPAVSDPVRLEDVTVEGRRLEDTAREFVGEVAAPARGRNIARWEGGICVGVANLQPEAAQVIADRISDVARGLGLKAGEPGCAPSVIIVATPNAKAFTPQFVAKRPALFRVGGSGMDRGANALREFEDSEAPVRWWHVSAPVDSNTGQIAVRIPGNENCASDGDTPCVPIINRFAASRLSTQIVDDLKRAFIIIDIDKIQGVNINALSDYLAMVTLAQVDPEGDTRSYSTVLNLFNNPQGEQGLTSWDEAYLTGLYQAQRTRSNSRANTAEVAASITQARREMLDQSEN